MLVGATLLIIWLSLTYRSLWAAHWPSYSDMVSSLSQPSAWLRWLLGDISEVAFYKHEFASIGLLAGAYLAYWAESNGQSLARLQHCLWHRVMAVADHQFVTRVVAE